MRHAGPLRERNVADLHGSVILPVAARDFILSAGLEFAHQALRSSPVPDDLAGNLGARSLVASMKILLVRAHCDHIAKGDLVADLAVELLDLDGLARCNPILFTATTNHRVHTASRSNCEPFIIRGYRGERQRAIRAGRVCICDQPEFLWWGGLRNLRP